MWKYLEFGTKNLEKTWNLGPKTLRKPEFWYLEKSMNPGTVSSWSSYQLNYMLYANCVYFDQLYSQISSQSMIIYCKRQQSNALLREAPPFCFSPLWQLRHAWEMCEIQNGCAHNTLCGVRKFCWIYCF